MKENVARVNGLLSGILKKAAEPGVTSLQTLDALGGLGLTISVQATRKWLSQSEATDLMAKLVLETLKFRV